MTISVTLYKQTDPRWGALTVGYGRDGVQADTFNAIGCTTTAGAMFATALGKNFDPVTFGNALKAIGGYTSVSGDSKYRKVYVVWAKFAQVLGVRFLQRLYLSQYTTEIDLRLKALLAKGIPQMIEVLHPSGIRHWVLSLGGGKIADPLDGKIKPFTTYKRVIGVALFDKL